MEAGRRCAFLCECEVAPVSLFKRSFQSAREIGVTPVRSALLGRIWKAQRPGGRQESARVAEAARARCLYESISPFATSKVCVPNGRRQRNVSPNGPRNGNSEGSSSVPSCFGKGPEGRRGRGGATFRGVLGYVKMAAAVHDFSRCLRL